ncbi:MAG: hypothetical protein ABIK79_05525 [Chloroflexota bacterium]
MDVWLFVFIVVLVAAFFLLRKFSGTEEEDAEAKPITVKSEVGFGIIALGVLTLFMPSAAGRIAALGFIEADGFAILIGSTLVMGILVTLAGVAVLLMKESGE